MVAVVGCAIYSLFFIAPYYLASAIIFATIYVSAGTSLSSIYVSAGTSLSSWLMPAVWAGVGCVVYFVILLGATVMQLLFTRQDFAARHRVLLIPWLSSRLAGFARRLEAVDKAPGTGWAANKLPRSIGRGYVKYADDEPSYLPAGILPGHGAALALLILTSVVYVGVGFCERSNIQHFQQPYVPVLGYVLLLFTLLCWLFSGLTFFFDRYRVPVLVPLVVLLYATSHWPGLESDYFYDAKDPVEQTKESAPHDDSIIVVAANGGGIQSAAWTARVLTGLEKECLKLCDRNFARKISLISSVSGGSVGTMYFVNEYDNDGSIPAKHLNRVVRRAQASSLDQIGWGLLYPDFSRTLLPYKPTWDRGKALQRAWRTTFRGDPEDDGISQRLSKWRIKAQRGDRPAVIFNSTVTETGEPLVMATADLTDEEIDQKMLAHHELFSRSVDKTDIWVVTAARLSASYPFVSPAARAEVDQKSANHLVDGGYYDNYGISSLVDWLDWKLENDTNIKRVLVVQILGQTARNYSDRSYDPHRRGKKRGWLFQALAPASTVLNVRRAGQASHSETELDLLIDKWHEDERDVDIQKAVFDFNGSSPPLSWHLTDQQKQDIENNWQYEVCQGANGGKGWRTVRHFLGARGESSACMPTP
jgi:hypothetical protein